MPVEQRARRGGGTDRYPHCRMPAEPPTLRLMERIETDVHVIGWGKAGKSLARTLGSAGCSVVMVEQSHQMYGGTSINIACVPTTALVHRAELRREADSAAGWLIDSDRI